jgi:hypothetical protein
MRSATAGPVPPLLGSIGLHGGVVLALLIAVRHPVRVPEAQHEHTDAWAGNAVEVDAVATPDATANLPSSAPATAQPEIASAAEPASAVKPDVPLVKTEEPSPERPTAKPAPRLVHPRPTDTSKPAAERAESAGAAPQAEATTGAGAATPATGAFGGEGLPPGVRSLPSAFTRAIPPATGADPLWQTLPTGSQHPFTIALEVDADGHISNAELVKEKDGSAPETQASHLRERVVALLGGGLFALQNNVGAGRELFRVTVTLSDREVHTDDDPAQLVERGFEPPRGASPGRAYFTLASGRHFEAKVQVLARP